MGIVSALVDKAGGGILTSVANAVNTFVETPDEKNAHELKKQALDMQIALKQLEVNQVEAKHPSVFVSGWRPAIGWVCGVAFAYGYILQPFMEFIIRIWIPDFPAPPSIDFTAMLPVLFGMLGLGGMRSWEKNKDIHRNAIGKKDDTS